MGFKVYIAKIRRAFERGNEESDTEGLGKSTALHDRLQGDRYSQIPPQYEDKQRGVTRRGIAMTTRDLWK